jgi:hypothetical protein
LDDNASGKGDDDEDSKDNIDKEGSGDQPTGNDPNGLDVGSGGIANASFNKLTIYYFLY